MKSKRLLMNILIALFFLASAQVGQAQKDGEAQSVSFDANNWATLKFSDRRSADPVCGLYVSYELTDKQEEALVIRVAHLHYRPRFFGAFSKREVGGETLPEDGRLYITPSRIIFVVEDGDQAHAFDVARTELKTKPVSNLNRYFFSGLQINLRDRLEASNSREQKFVFLIPGGKRCYQYVDNSGPYEKLLRRAMNDFSGAMSQFKQMASSLKQSGRIDQATPPRRLP